MQVQVDDPARPDVYALLEDHLRNMHELSPPESVLAHDYRSDPHSVFMTLALPSQAYS